MESLFIVLGALCLFFFIVLLCAIPFLRSHRAQRTLTPIHYEQNYTITEEYGTGKKKEGKTRKEPSYPIPFGKFARWAWIQQWYWYHYSRDEETRQAAEDALKLFSHGLGQVFYEWIIQGQPEASEPYIIEASVSEVAPPDQQPEVQEQTEQGSSPPQWSLASLKAEGQWAHYHVYAMGILGYLYHHLPASGTLHRDSNKQEPGLVMGKVIRQSQWDEFIGSSDPTSQKGQGLLRRAGLLREVEREGGRKVTVFAHRDVGQAISILTQYLIQEQQGHTKQKDEQAPQQRREDEEEKSTGDTPLPLPHYQFQEYR